MHPRKSAAKPVTLGIAVAFALTRFSAAADNTLTDQERRDGWVLLFDGKTPAGWENNGQPLPAANVQDGAINPHKAGAYVTYHREKLDNFVLSCEFKVSPGANSGIFFRVGDPNDPVQSGFEMQVFDSAGKAPDKHTCGAIYDAVAPSADAAKPAGEWNRVVITAERNLVKVVLNGRPVVDLDLDRWTEAGKNPDGTKNKFKTALKHFPRAGYIGLQDHNHPVCFRNIKLKRLKPTAE